MVWWKDLEEEEAQVMVAGKEREEPGQEIHPSGSHLRDTDPLPRPTFCYRLASGLRC